MDVPVKVLLDTDTQRDCDDTGAEALLHALADRGEARILGVALNAYDKHQKHSAVVSAINHYYGRGDIPVAISKRGPGEMPTEFSNFFVEIFSRFSHDGLTDPERPDAVDLYFNVLNAAEDHSVVVVSIGFLTNLADVLKREGGYELLAKKVREFSIMGGRYPEGGKECNFQFQGTGTDTKFVLENLPPEIPITYADFNLGCRILTGTGYKHAPESPMKTAYSLVKDSLNTGRGSWDQVAALYAVRGTGPEKNPYFRRAPGINHIDNEGYNTWEPDDSSIHAYLEPVMPIEELTPVIEELMTAPPVLKNEE